MAVKNEGLAGTLIRVLGEGALEALGVEGKGATQGRRSVEAFEESATGVTPPDLDAAREKQVKGQQKVEDIADWRRMAIEQLGPVGGAADIATKALGYPLRAILPESADVALGKEPSGAQPLSFGRGELYDLDPVESAQEAAAAVQRASFTTAGEQNSFITELEQLDKVRTFNTLKPLIANALGVTQRELDRWGPDRVEDAIRFRNEKYKRNQDKRREAADIRAATKEGERLELSDEVVNEVAVRRGTDEDGNGIFQNKITYGNGRMKLGPEYTKFAGSQAGATSLGIDLEGNTVPMSHRRALESTKTSRYQDKRAQGRGAQDELMIANYKKRVNSQRIYSALAFDVAERLQEGGFFIGTIERMAASVDSAFSQYRDFTDSMFGSWDWSVPENVRNTPEEDEYKPAPTEREFRDALQNNIYPYLSAGMGDNLRRDLIDSAGLRASIYKLALLHARTNTESDRPVSKAAFERTINGLGLNSGSRELMESYLRQSIIDGAREVNTMRETIIGLDPLVNENTFPIMERMTRDLNLRKKMYPDLPDEDLYDHTKWKVIEVWNPDTGEMEDVFTETVPGTPAEGTENGP